jgi:hypothetical protein
MTGKSEYLFIEFISTTFEQRHNEYKETFILEFKKVRNWKGIYLFVILVSNVN